MAEPARYQRREGALIAAVRLDLDKENPRYEVFKDGQRCREPIWLLQENGGVSVVGDRRFRRIYEETGVGQYMLPAVVEAEPACSDGRLGDGQRYVTGDYIVRTLSAPVIEFALCASRFEAAYEPASGSPRSRARPSRKRYRAFVSYSRQDTRIAARLHRKLERYRIPRDLVGGGARRLGRFFKDDDELAGSEHLGSSLEGAIDDSENLIVVASPDSARSDWVNREILRFKRRRGALVFAVIARGIPDSGDPETECFAPGLRRCVDGRGNLTEESADPPLAPNLTAESFSCVVVRLVAGLLDIPFDALWKREVRRIRRRRAAMSATGTALLCAALLGLSTLTDRTDAASLRSRAARIGAEQWRYYSEASRFDPAYRAALAASVLQAPQPGEPWDLGSPIESTSNALGLSGRIVPRRRVFGDYPDTSSRGNFRDDIPGADPTRRLALRVQPEVRDLCFSGNGARIALCASDGTFIVKDLGSGIEQCNIRFDDVDGSSRLGLDDSGATALVSGGERIHVVDVSAGTSRAVPTPDLMRVYEIAFVGDSWRIAGSGKVGTIVARFDPDTGRVEDAVRLADFTPYYSNAFHRGTGGFVGYASYEGLVPVGVEGEDPEPIQFDGLAQGVGQVKSIALGRGGRLVALGGNGSGSDFGSPIQVVDLPNGAESARLRGHTGEVYALAFQADSGLLASAGSDFAVRLWDAESGRELIRMAGHLGDIVAMRFSPDGSLLATAASDGMVLVWDLRGFSSIERGGLTSLQAAPRGWESPSTIVTPGEREAASAFQGRPWDIRDWRDPNSLAGRLQSVRAGLVRWLGWSALDYRREAR